MTINTRVFTKTLRGRPIVLVSHHIEKLSFVAGRDVSGELYEISKEWFEVKTLGQLMRALESRFCIGQQHISEQAL